MNTISEFLSNNIQEYELSILWRGSANFYETGLKYISRYL